MRHLGLLDKGGAIKVLVNCNSLGNRAFGPAKGSDISSYQPSLEVRIIWCAFTELWKGTKNVKLWFVVCDGIDSPEVYN